MEWLTRWTPGTSVFLMKTTCPSFRMIIDVASEEKKHKITPCRTIIPLFSFISSTERQPSCSEWAKFVFYIYTEMLPTLKKQFCFVLFFQLAPVPSHETFFAWLEVSRALECGSQWHNGTHRCMRLACEPSGAPRRVAASGKRMIRLQCKTKSPYRNPSKEKRSKRRPSA